MTVRILVREGIWLIVSTVLAVVLWLRVVADHNQWLSVVQEHWRGTLTSPLPPAPGVELLIAYAAALYAGFAVFGMEPAPWVGQRGGGRFQFIEFIFVPSRARVGRAATRPTGQLTAGASFISRFVENRRLPSTADPRRV
jgi:hypothetical protein